MKTFLLASILLTVISCSNPATPFDQAARAVTETGAGTISLARTSGTYAGAGSVLTATFSYSIAAGTTANIDFSIHNAAEKGITSDKSYNLNGSGEWSVTVIADGRKDAEGVLIEADLVEVNSSGRYVSTLDSASVAFR